MLYKVEHEGHCNVNDIHFIMYDIIWCCSVLPGLRTGLIPSWTFPKGLDWATKPGWMEGVRTTVGCLGTGIISSGSMNCKSSGSRAWDTEEVELASSRSSKYFGERKADLDRFAYEKNKNKKDFVKPKGQSNDQQHNKRIPSQHWVHRYTKAVFPLPQTPFWTPVSVSIITSMSFTVGGNEYQSQEHGAQQACTRERQRWAVEMHRESPWIGLTTGIPFKIRWLM